MKQLVLPRNLEKAFFFKEKKYGGNTMLCRRKLAGTCNWNYELDINPCILPNVKLYFMNTDIYLAYILDI